MQKSKITSYLLYALGEIILVVIGILIAIQINNLNEENKTAKIERTYLTRLRQDLEDNISTWENLIQSEEYRFEGIEEWVKFSLNKNEDSVFTVIQYFNSIARWDDLTVNQITFNEMQSSGKLDVISNDSIKINLLQLDQLYKKVIERQATRKLGHEKYIGEPVTDIINNLNFIPLDDSFKHIHPKTYTEKELESYLAAFRKDLFGLFNNQRFMNSIVGLMYSEELLLGEIQAANSQAKKLKELIDKELENS